MQGWPGSIDFRELGFRVQGLGFRDYLEGRGDLVSRLIMRVTVVIIWLIRVISLLTKPPDPPSRVKG